MGLQDNQRDQPWEGTEPAPCLMGWASSEAGQCPQAAAPWFLPELKKNMNSAIFLKERQ